jgi:hypothetical protein
MPLLPVIVFGDGPGRAGMLRYRPARSKNSLQSRNDSPILGAETLGVKWRNPLGLPQKLRNEMGNRTREAGSSNAGESGTGSVKDIQAHVRHSKADATAQRVHAGVAGECAAARYARLRFVPRQPRSRRQHQENSCSSVFFSSPPCLLITTTGSVSEILARRGQQERDTHRLRNDNPTTH